MSSLDCQCQHLPIELIADILSRLTLEDVMCYRCVSKSWFALINDSYFIKKHAERDEGTADLSLLITGFYSEEFIYKVDLNNALPKHKIARADVCTRTVLKNFSAIVGSCNGLVCFSYGSIYAAIWNPSTTEFNKIPPLQWNSVVSYGFGHDRTSGEYKVLAITRSEVGFKVRVYSLKKKSWDKKTRRFLNISIRLKDVGTFASNRNAIHWIMERKGVDWNNPHKVIVAFDIGVDNGCHEVQQPDYKIKPYWLALGALRGCLCIYSTYHNLSSDLWVLNKESWTRLISFADPLPNWAASGYMKPIAYYRGGDKVLLYDCPRKKLIWYDLKTKTVTTVELWRNLPVTGVCLHRNIKYDKRREGETGVCLHRNIKYDKRREGEGRRNLFSSVFKIFQCGK